MKLMENGSIVVDGIFETKETRKITLDNHSEIYPVYSIKLDNLYYNDQNDRIATWISQYKTDNDIDSIDKDDIEAYNKIIENFIVESNEKAINKTKNSIVLKGQEEPGIVLTDGRVIDGNRRFTCLRQIQRESGQTGYFNAIILPFEYENNRKKIKMLELEIQLGKEEKVDYDPIDKLVGIYTNIVETGLLTVQEYANMVSSTVREIQKEVEKATLMVEFLEFIRAEKKYHLARIMKLSEPLKELSIALSKCKSDDERETLKNIAFMNFATGASRNAANGELGQKAYVRHIKAIAENDACRKGYVEEQEELVDDFCDKIDELFDDNGHITEKELTELSADDALVNTLTNETDKWNARANSEANKNEPAKILDKVINLITSIDTNIFRKLNEEQLDAVQRKLSEAQQALEDINGDLDV